MNYPTAVDLRANYDVVYNQGSDSSCGPHALTATLDCMYERATGVQHRFDKDHLWRWAKFHNNIADTVNTGTDAPSLCKALNINGAKLGDKTITGFRMVQTRIRYFGVDHFKHLLCSGIPFVFVLRMPLNFAGLTGPWQSHTLELDKTGTQDRFHFVAGVGYDDACQRVLMENSWGEWGDGGFFGVPYKDIVDPNFFCGLCHVDGMPISVKPVEGYTVPTPYLTPQDQTAFCDRVGPALKDHLMAVLASGEIPGIITECKKWGVTDKHLEALMGWPRGAVWDFHNQNPAYDWSGFLWDQR